MMLRLERRFVPAEEVRGTPRGLYLICVHLWFQACLGRS
jgi:hypothetical protein